MVRMTVTDDATDLLRRQLGAEVISDSAIEVRPLLHGLAAVVIPTGLTYAEENKIRAAIGARPRTTSRRRKAS